MKNALERQLATTGWHLLGALIGLVALLAIAGVWGRHIEDRLNQGEKAHVSDHREIGRINQALHQAHIAFPHRGGDALQKPSSKGHQHPSPSSKGGGRNGKGGVGKGGSEGPTAPGKGGSGGGSAPPKGGSREEPGREPPAPPANEAAKSQQPTLPATVEAAGGAVQGTVEGAGEAGDCVVGASC